MNAYLWGLVGSLVLAQAVAQLLGVRVYRQPMRLFLTLVSVFIPFIAWDITAIIRGHWFFGSDMLPIRVFGILPLEEILFFIVIPYCALNAWEVARVLREKWAQ